MAGHLYYFLSVLQPRAGGPNLIVTPSFVHALVRHAFGGAGFVASGAGTAYVPPAAPRAFQGRGNRLGAD